MDNINDILRAKRIVRQNGYTIKKPARDYDYEREDRMNLIRAKRIVKDAGYSYVKPNDGVSDDDDFEPVSPRRPREEGPADRFANRRYDDDDYEPTPRRRRVVDDYDDLPPRRRTARDYDLDNDDDFEPPMRRRVNPSDDDSFTTRRQRLQRPGTVAPETDAPNFPGKNRLKNPAQAPAAPAAPAAPEGEETPAQPAAPEQPVKKTRQEIYQDIAAKYV